MGTSVNRFFTNSRNIALLSLVAGIASLVSVFSPPSGLFLGASAILLAVLARMNGGHFSGVSAAGIILGIFGVILSVLLFFNFILLVRIMDDPERLLSQITDPALASQLREILTYYRTLLNEMN